MEKKDRLLREQLIKTLHDPTLRHGIKHQGRDHPAVTYQDMRMEIHRNMEDPHPQ